jgi:CBS domain-containing protein
VSSEPGAVKTDIHISRRVLAVTPETDPMTALSVMRGNGVRHLPVVQGQRCIGLLTEAHLLEAIIGMPGPSVGWLCGSPAPTVPAGATPSTMAAAILAGGLDAALVVHGAALVGIVTSTDVLAQLAEQETSGTESSDDR